MSFILLWEVSSDSWLSCSVFAGVRAVLWFLLTPTAELLACHW